MNFWAFFILASFDVLTTILVIWHMLPEHDFSKINQTYKFVTPIYFKNLLSFPNIISKWNSKFLDHCVQGEKTGEKPETMTQKDAMMFPIIASCALGGLYMFFKIFDKEYINLLLSGYFFVLGVFALSHMAGPWLSRKIYKNLFVPLEDFRCIFTRYVFAKLFTSK